MDPADEATDLAERERTAAIARHRAIGSAGRLARRDGSCRRCGEPIDPRRLAAQPDALNCIACELELEKEIGR